MCSVSASSPTNTQPSYVHNPYLDGGAYGNSVDANRIGTSALTIGLDPTAAAAVNSGGNVTPQVKSTAQPAPTAAPAGGNSSGTTANRMTI